LVERRAHHFSTQRTHKLVRKRIGAEEMADITRWDPFAEVESLRHTMNHLFGETRPWRGFDNGSSDAYFPLDLFETHDEVVVRASLPGVTPDDIDISLTGQVLTLKGQSREDTDDKAENYYRRERKHGTFVRQLTLPAEVDSAKAEATFEHGVLRLALPKAESMKPRTIRVKSAEMLDGGHGSAGES
jgi:HSP20 family protein